MPVISESELAELKEKVENAEENQRVNYNNHRRALNEEQENTRKFKIASIILGILALLGIAGTLFLMLKGGGGNSIPKKEHLAKVQSLEDKVSALEEEMTNQSLDEELDGDKGSLTDELTYAVQIGAFEKKDLSMYSDNFVNFKEIKSGDFNKYSVGNFETLKEAQLFRSEMVKLGFKNAFIASYQDGKRIKIEKTR